MKKWLKISLITVACLAVAACLTVGITVVCVVNGDDYVPLDLEKLSLCAVSVTITDGEGNELNYPLQIDNRKIVNLKELNAHTLDAFVSIEDKRFYSHNGIDLRSMARATLKNAQSMSYSQGGSTITQQLIKNTHLNNKKEVKRKINEVILAMQLEKQFDKEEILQMYLNTVYFGGSCYGIESASNAYFDKPSSELSIAESALLAGMLKAPNSYSPLNNMSRAVERRNVVLLTMVDNGYIDNTQYDEAINTIHSAPSQSDLQTQKGYEYAVIAEACEILNMTPIQLLNSRLTIQTFLDQKAQDVLQKAILADDSQTIGGDVPQKTAILTNNSGGVIAYYSVSPYDALRQGRQIGSTAKPLCVYAPALQLGEINALTPILDERTAYGSYVPTNVSNKYYGWITATEALAKSVNSVAVKLLNNIGANTACEYLRRNGVQTSDADNNLTLALGCISQGTDILTLNNAYRTLANGGTYSKCGFIASIYNEKGLIYQLNAKPSTVFDSQTAYITTNMLCNATKEGTGRRLNLPYEIASKTGTVGSSANNDDALVCAYTSQHTLTVWISDNEHKLKNVSGANQPTLIAREIFSALYSNGAPDSFSIPDDVFNATIDASILNKEHKVVLAKESAKQTVSAYFSRANPPILPQEKETQRTSLQAQLNGNAVELYSANASGALLMRKSQTKSIMLTDNFQTHFIDKHPPSGKCSYYLARRVNGKLQPISNELTVHPQAVNKQYQTKKADSKDSFLDEILDYWYVN